MEPLVSVIIPVHNEEEVLRVNTETLRNHLLDNLGRHEILLCENGSTDATLEIAHTLEDTFNNIRVISLSEANLSEALCWGIRTAIGEKIVYYPIDLSISPEFISESTRLLDVFDIVVGSKRLTSELDKRPPSRIISSKAYHGLVQKLYGVHLSDTTCVKAYRRSRILRLIERVPTSSMIYETELLMEAEQEGLNIVEIPVRVNELRESRIKLHRRVTHKLRDLLSARLCRISMYVGFPMVSLGGVSLLSLVWDKIRGVSGGFTNPYSFLLSMLLIISGIQILAFGLMTNLILQIRKYIHGNR